MKKRVQAPPGGVPLEPASGRTGCGARRPSGPSDARWSAPSGLAAPVPAASDLAAPGPSAPSPAASPTLLAVDLGLWTGLAVFGADGRCLRYRSTHFPSVSALKQALPRILDEAPGLVALFCEGDRHLGSLWTKLAEKRGARCVVTHAERWREVLLAPHERRDGAQAKAHADLRAREVLASSGLKRPTSLRHDAAEAILLGLWGCLELGWVQRSPWTRSG